MNEFRQWVLCLIITAAAGTFVCAVSPRGTTEKAVRTVAGIFVVVTMCTPLSQLNKTELVKNVFLDSYVISDNSEALKEQMLEQCKKSIEEQLAPIARKYSVTVCQVTMDAYFDEYGSIIIQRIHLDITSENPDSAVLFISEAQAALGVPLTA